jgi:hypothetical protein
MFNPLMVPKVICLLLESELARNPTAVRRPVFSGPHVVPLYKLPDRSCVNRRRPDQLVECETARLHYGWFLSPCWFRRSVLQCWFVEYVQRRVPQQRLFDYTLCRKALLDLKI